MVLEAVSDCCRLIGRPRDQSSVQPRAPLMMCHCLYHTTSRCSATCRFIGGMYLGICQCCQCRGVPGARSAKMPHGNTAAVVRPSRAAEVLARQGFQRLSTVMRTTSRHMPAKKRSVVSKEASSPPSAASSSSCRVSVWPPPLLCCAVCMHVLPPAWMRGTMIVPVTCCASACTGRFDVCACHEIECHDHDPSPTLD